MAQSAAEREARTGTRLAALRTHAGVAARAGLPLSAFLLLEICVVLRVGPRHVDEMILGVLFAPAGMMLFSCGVGTGLARLSRGSSGTCPFPS